MGLRYRKSINLGGGFRVNLSKSGVGYSFGVKGARITKTAKGTTRSTVGIPGTGISYVQEKGKKKHTAKQTRNSEVMQDNSEIENTNIINAGESQPAEYSDFLDAVKKVQKMNTLSTILICTFILCAFPIFIITGIVGIILKVYVHKKMAVNVEYELDDYAAKVYDSLTATWMELNNSEKFWQVISSSKIENKKANGGAHSSIKRIPTKATKKCPYFLRTNIEPFGLKMKKQSLFFLPDKLLIIHGSKVGAIKYDDVQLELGATRFLEEEKVPSDAKVVGKTWLKVNKDGSPDKRFKDNKQVPICEYGKVIVKSGDLLNIVIMCSNLNIIEKMRSYTNEYNNVLNANT